MRVNDLCDLYLAHAETYYRKPVTKRLTNEYGLIERSLDPLRAECPGLDVSAVDSTVLASARRWLLANTDNCRNTVNGKVSRMVRMFAWGADPEQRLVPASVMAELNLLKPLAYGRTTARETEGLSAVSRERVMDFLAALSDLPRSSRSDRPRKFTARERRARLQLATMVELQLETGMRSGELCSMEWERIDRTRARWVYTPREHKSEHRGKVRLVVIREVEQALITRWMRQAGLTGGRLFTLNRMSYRKIIQRNCERAGLEPWTPHQLRHTFATETRRSAGLDKAQALLGHASVRTTEGYAKNDADELLARLGQGGDW